MFQEIRKKLQNISKLKRCKKDKMFKSWMFLSTATQSSLVPAGKMQSVIYQRVLMEGSTSSHYYIGLVVFSRTTRGKAIKFIGETVLYVGRLRDEKLCLAFFQSKFATTVAGPFTIGLNPFTEPIPPFDLEPQRLPQTEHNAVLLSDVESKKKDIATINDFLAKSNSKVECIETFPRLFPHFSEYFDLKLEEIDLAEKKKKKVNK